MFAKSTWIRAFLATLTLAFLAVPAFATGLSSATHRGSTEASKHEIAVEPTPTGSSELGILIIIGIVVVVIFMAWLLSRVGDDNSSASDGTII